jgi:IS5 family transposase
LKAGKTKQKKKTKRRKNEIDNRRPSLFQMELVRMINLQHPLVKLAERIDWKRLENELDGGFLEIPGASANPTRLMGGLHCLKHLFTLSDEETVEQWMENPYWQHFCGMKYFTREPPIDDPSLMSRWRRLTGDRGGESLLKETMEAGLRMGAIGEERPKT